MCCVYFYTKNDVNLSGVEGFLDGNGFDSAQPDTCFNFM